MAEGGTPKEETSREEAPREDETYNPEWNWDRDSLEFVFASDLVHFVVERYDKEWQCNKFLTHCSPITPFNTEIQKAVEEILRKDSFYLEKVFEQLLKPCKKMRIYEVNVCAVFLKVHYFGTFQSFPTLLKYFCMISHFSAWCQNLGMHEAPFFCVDIILKYLREFLVEHHFTCMDAFWYHFEREARNALTLPKIVMLKKEELRFLPAVINRMKVKYENLPTEKTERDLVKRNPLLWNLLSSAFPK